MPKGADAQKILWEVASMVEAPEMLREVDWLMLQKASSMADAERAASIDDI